LESVAPDAGGSGVGGAVAVASPAERQRLMMDALELAQRGAAGGASNLMALVRREAPEDGLVAAVAAYLDQGRRAKAQSDLRALIDGIAKQNAARQANAAAGAADEAFTRPRIVAALGPETRQGGADAASRAMLYRIALRSELEGQGRMQLVEREAMDAILQEMNLGTSDLADPRARTQIGRLLPAGLLLLGDVMESGGGETVFMRLVETETSRQLAAFSAERKGDREVLDVCHGLATQVLAKAVALAPLTAKVVKIEGDRLQADVGQFHGAGDGMTFAIVRRPKDKPTLTGGFKDERVGEAKLKDLGQFSSGFDATWTDAAAKQSPEMLWVKELPAL
jgi:hypothetical protein